MKERLSLVFISVFLVFNCVGNKPEINNFQEEFSAFIEASNDYSNTGVCFIILFKDSPDSTVSFILSKHPHRLMDNSSNKYKTKAYVKGDYTLFVNAPKQYSFEYLFQGWAPIANAPLKDEEVHFIKRCDYLVKGGMLYMVLNQMNPPAAIDEDQFPKETLLDSILTYAMPSKHKEAE